ncbi:MAG TPA: hypothetical protein VEG64_05700 [Candidatus Sulfotelmatobacter sp.]|nr:hypothetical protein [Candidatus Sulfotelmatobacter sp.]
MSSGPLPSFLESEDPREAELIRSLVEKTRQGKISWTKRSSALTASTSSGIQINFVLGMQFLDYSAGWQLLTVRNKSGSELVKVNNTMTTFSVLAGGKKSAAVEAADELYTLASRTAGDDLDRAIDAIKNL